MNPLHAAARAYAACGKAIHPLVPLGKTPLTKHGVKDATTDLAIIDAWWEKWPDANIGMATGKVNGISLLDEDTKEWEGKHGDATLAALVAQHGPLPKTPTQRTWSGGHHYVFAYDERAANSVNCYGPNLDGRNDGGYIVVQPSFVQEETREGVYVWRWDFDTPLAPMPEWLLERLTATNGNGSPRKPRTAAVKALREGKARNNGLTSFAGALRRKGAEPVEIKAALLGMNDATRAGLPENEITKIANSVGNYEPAEGADDPGGERFTDMMNAGRLAKKIVNRAGYVWQMKNEWFVFQHGRLLLEPVTSMVPFVQEVSGDLFEESDRIMANVVAAAAALEQAPALTGKALRQAAADGGDAKLDALANEVLRAERLKAAATYLESRQGCFNTVEMAKAEPACRIGLAELDAHPTWLNTPSGTLDLESGEVHPHRFSDYLTKVSGAGYDPAATCPRWEAFLEEVLPDPEVRAFMQRSAGYALTDDTMERCLWFLWGTGRNGKSTYLDALREVMGDYASNADASTLMVKEHGNPMKNDVAKLRGARMVSANEAEEGDRLAESQIKQMTGGRDPLTVRKMYADFFDFVPTFKIFLATNHKPAVKGVDPAIWDRIHLVDFTVRIADDKVDRDLPTKLAAEKSGILNWAIAGYREWRKGGLKPPEVVRKATEDYKREMDPLGTFFEDECVTGDSHWVPAAELYRAYRAWTEREGVRFPLTKNALGLKVMERGYPARRRAHTGERGYQGFKLHIR